MDDLSTIRAKLRRLRDADTDLQVFGAAEHGYELAPPLLDSNVDEVERQFGATLPSEYRSFLTELGSGGAGPAYGVFVLARSDGRWRWRGDGAELTTDLSRPFRHISPWNLDGYRIWDREPLIAQFPDETAFYTAYDEWLPEFEALYWSTQWTEGAVCLCHLGCALRTWLVVSGPERGNMWFDGTADRGGLRPIAGSNASRVTFLAWYEQWLDESLREVDAG